MAAAAPPPPPPSKRQKKSHGDEDGKKSSPLIVFVHGAGAPSTSEWMVRSVFSPFLFPPCHKAITTLMFSYKRSVISDFFFHVVWLHSFE